MTDRQTDRQTELTWHIRAIATLSRVKIGRLPTPCRLLLHKLQAARMHFGRSAVAVRSAIGIQAETERNDVSVGYPKNVDDDL